MAAKPRVKYEVYERWYDKFASTGEMKQDKLSKPAFMAQWRDARKAGFDMKDFSRTVASRQRAASELQMHATFSGTKQAMREFRKEIRAKKREFINQELRNYITKIKGNISDAEMSRQIQRIKKKGVPEYIKIGAELKTRNFYEDQKNAIIKSFPVDMQEEYRNMMSKYELAIDYSGMTYKEFKRDQTSIVRSARTLTEDREIWDEAFRLAFDSPKERRA